MERYAVIVAGGTGTRMNNKVPKQFLKLAGIPVLMHTLEAWALAVPDIQLILVLPENQVEYWKMLCEEHDFRRSHHIVPGGETRFHSVKNGLIKAGDDALIAIHDGVRPLVSAAVIKESFEIAAKKGNAIAAVELKDSIRQLTDNESKRVDRTAYRLIQTPQTFRSELIKKAYQTAYDPSFTDDASVLEKMGEKIHLFQGTYNNLKITTPEDLAMAGALIHCDDK